MTPILGIWASQMSGHLWAPAGAYDALATVTLSATTSTITFAGIPSGYKHLQLRISARDARALNGLNPIDMYANSDTTYTNYRNHYIYGDGASTGAGTGQASGQYFSAGGSVGNSTTANIFSAGIVDILDYANTTKNKVARTLTGADFNGSGEIDFISSLWMSTSAITSLTLVPRSSSGFLQYSSFALYGIR